MRLPDDIRDLMRGRVVGIFGMPGAGKTVDLAQIALFEPSGVFIIDPVGALTKALRGRQAYLVDIPKGFDLKATWEATEALLDENEKVVWNFEDWDPEEMQEIANALVPYLKRLVGVLVCIDEMQYIAPEPTADMGRGAQRFKHWVTARRNQPVALAWSSQRPAFVSMMIRGVTDAFLVHRLFWPNDIEVVRKVVADQEGVDPDEVAARVKSQAPGEVVFIDLPFMA